MYAMANSTINDLHERGIHVGADGYRLCVGSWVYLLKEKVHWLDSDQHGFPTRIKTQSVGRIASFRRAYDYDAYDNEVKAQADCWPTVLTTQQDYNPDWDYSVMDLISDEGRTARAVNIIQRKWRQRRLVEWRQRL